MATTVTTSTASHYSHRYWMGSVNHCIGHQLAPGYAIMQKVGDHWANYRDISNVQYYDKLKAITLMPDPSSLYVDMVLADFTVTDGNWLATGALTNAVTYLGTQEIDGVHGVSKTASFTLEPTVLLTIQRQPVPANLSILTQVWSISLGNGFFTISWGAGQPVLTISYTDINSQAAVRQQTLSGSEFGELSTASELYWEIRPTGSGECLITCSALSEQIHLVDVGIIPAGKFHIEANLGGWWFNVVQLKFQTEGSFTSEIIDVGYAYSDVYGYMPSVGGSGVGGAAGEGAYWVNSSNRLTMVSQTVTGTEKIVTVNYFGDGYHTPYLTLWQIMYAPIFGTATPDWLEITGQIFSDSVDDSQPGKNEPAILSLELNNYQNAWGTFLADAERTDLAHGVVALAATLEKTIETTTVTTVDGGAPSSTLSTQHVVIPAFVGLLAKDDRKMPVNRADTITLHFADPLSCFAGRELLAPPCLLGWLYPDVIGTLCGMVGIPNDHISIDGSFTTRYLDDPGRNYDNPPWTPEVGTNSLDILRHFLGNGMRIMCVPTMALGATIPSFSIEIKPVDPDSSTVVLIDTGVGGTTFADTTATQDYSDCPTHVTLIGIDADGHQLVMTGPVPYTSLTPGANGYLGGRKDHIVVNADLKTVSTMLPAYQAEINSVQRPLTSGEIETTEFDAAAILSDQEITVTQASSRLDDFTNAGKLYRTGAITRKHKRAAVETKIQVYSLW